jgi:hypothetical protein
LPLFTNDDIRLSVRWFLFWLFFATWADFSSCAASADTSPSPQPVVQEFSGSGSTTTALFKVQDRWEVRWNARQVVSVAVMSSTGSLVTGAAGVLRGSLFVPAGGQYYFKISDGTVAPPDKKEPAPVDDSTAPDTADYSSSPSESGISWHLQVVQLDKSVASSQALTVYTPFFTVPDSAIVQAAPPPPPPPPPTLTPDQARAMVAVKGDNAQGIGFLIRMPDSLYVATHLHLLVANPNIQISTRSGTPITTLSLKGAVDRDLALFTVQENHLSSLPAPADAAKAVQVGDPILIPDLNNLDAFPLGKAGFITGVNLDRLDFQCPLTPDDSGVPIVHVKSGNALAILTATKRNDLTFTIAQAWPGNPAPGAARILPYYGIRLSGVRGWETYDPARFLAETLFLKQFHQDTRCLDSYLNVGKRRTYDTASGGPDFHYFLNNAKIHAASDTYKQLANDADRPEAARELLSDLEEVADSGVSTLQDPSQLYAYNQTWAREELAYRNAIKKELDDLSNNLTRLDNLARVK